jgi:hypothetical protein
MTTIADDLDHVVETNDDGTLDDWGSRRGKGYSKETLDRIKKTALALRALERAVHHIDYLLSGDHAEDSFDRAWRRDVESKGGLDG